MRLIFFLVFSIIVTQDHSIDYYITNLLNGEPEEAILNIKKLEEIVEKLESGDIDLEKSVELYEQGMVLKNNCEEKLKKVELQIKKIKLESNKIKKENFE